jgi:hypothetical protein
MVIGKVPIARREVWTAAAVFALLTLVCAYPLSTRAASVMLEDQPDFHLFIWTFGWLAHAWSTDPGSLFDANIFYPLENTLAFSENLIGSGFIAAPVIWLTANHVLATNVVSLTSVVLCGVGAYLLGRTLGMRPPAAFVCAVIFAFCPPRFFRIGQLHLTAVQWIPFALAYVHGYFSAGRARELKIAAAFFSLQALATGHGAAFAVVAITGLLIYRFAAGDPVAPVRRLRDLGITGGLLLLPAILIAVPYHFVQRDHGLRRTLDNAVIPSVSFLASPSNLHQAMLSLFVPLSSVNDVAPAFLFPGYVPPVLAILAIGLAGRGLVRDRGTDPTLFYAGLAVVTILLIVGPPLGIWRFVYWLPGLNFIRVPSRFMILTVLALAALSGLAFERLHRRFQWSMPWLTASVLSLLLLVEFAAIPLKVTPFTTRPLAAERWLADQPKPFVVAEVPVFGVGRDHSTYMLHSMAHWQKTVHGFSGFDPPDHMRLYNSMKSFPSAESLQHLREFGVTYVVLHIDRYDHEEWAPVAARLPAAEGELEVVFQDMRSRVYRLRPASAAPR